MTRPLVTLGPSHVSSLEHIARAHGFKRRLDAWLMQVSRLEAAERRRHEAARMFRMVHQGTGAHVLLECDDPLAPTGGIRDAIEARLAEGDVPVGHYRVEQQRPVERMQWQVVLEAAVTGPDAVARIDDGGAP